ncbi:hypothetical protein BKA69DRAFT_1068006 [Paraphysoderma sedebokerense]|nr:hypothetical protein BKA69DRAFT_1068006 [Paraphysoderma sedebokerense]
MSDPLRDYVDHIVEIITNDGRVIIGKLRGYDQTTNVILEKSEERIYGGEDGVETQELGLYILRGDQIAIIGAIDPDKDAAINFASVQAEPIKPIQQHVL